ncbi:MAG: hypothetical protein JST00_42925 [Deltaproteobacteria bacterium]|nr:hypothetical protein [Deltaproteobacteria bacterium]
MAKVSIVGVRHHSPACARLVEHVIATERPRFVLVEGPCDMNERMGELLLPHRFPIALFTWRQSPEEGWSRGTWTPFCAYSPEWLAVQKAAAIGATSAFMDLPAWHDAFEGEENRYSDRHVRTSKAIAQLCAELGFEGSDALWDHLFEGPRELDALRRDLTTYFAELRSDEPAGDRDGPREDHMARWIAWAARTCDREGSEGGVVAVCGGWHEPALLRLWPAFAAEEPTAPPVMAEAPSDGSRIGSYYVPFSFKRLDSFSGYASGMPSPGFYQAVWDHGAGSGGEEMLHVAIRHLRARSQRVSVADAIAARTLADGLRLLRGHAALARIDVLDGLAGALVKDALDAPLPWTRRGVLGMRTDPLLVELVAAFSGDRVGELAPGTPRPPLAHDVWAELERVGIAVERTERKLRVDLSNERGIAQSHVLHRLRILGIPGFERVRGPSFARHATSLDEQWTVVRRLETDAQIVEAALHGATLETAAASKLEERTRGSVDLPEVAAVLVEAALGGIAVLAERWLALIAAMASQEPSFDALGVALARLVHLHRGELAMGRSTAVELARVVEACFERGLWLFEGLQGATAPFHEPHVMAIKAMRDALRLERDRAAGAAQGEGSLRLDEARARAVCARRARDAGAPPGVRGAALGFTWSAWAEDPEAEERDAITILRAAALASTMGDFLAGLFALAREEVTRAPALLAAIDVAVVGFTLGDFQAALPSLRQAFAYFPPRERLAIAEVLVHDDEGATDPMTLVGAKIDAGLFARGVEREARARDLARRLGLEESEGEVSR